MERHQHEEVGILANASQRLVIALEDQRVALAQADLGQLLGHEATLAPQRDDQRAEVAPEIDLGQGAADQAGAGCDDGLREPLGGVLAVVGRGVAAVRGLVLGHRLECHAALLAQGNQPAWGGVDEQHIIRLQSAIAQRGAQRLTVTHPASNGEAVRAIGVVLPRRRRRARRRVRLLAPLVCLARALRRRDHVALHRRPVG